MDWVERLNQSVSYIEDNLDGEIDYNQASQIACCSTYHYQRMFSYIAGIPLSEYIRRRASGGTRGRFSLSSYYCLEEWRCTKS